VCRKVAWRANSTYRRERRLKRPLDAARFTVVGEPREHFFLWHLTVL